MRTVILLLALLMASTGPAHAERKSITFFSDGALVEIEAVAIHGRIELPLPGGLAPDSLRVVPLKDTIVRRVEMVPRSKPIRNEKELEQLREQRLRLQDRLQALATREEIFTAAAKSQSGKAPRKTKTNPDPLQSIRAGTDFAIAQLEAVYTARRRTEQEIRRVDSRLAAIRPGAASAESTARIAVTPAQGRVRIRYHLADQGWRPRYDLHLNGSDMARLVLYGSPPAGYDGYAMQAVAGPLAPGASPAATVPAGGEAQLAQFQLPLAEQSFREGLRPAFSGLLTNSAATYLPPGEASLYQQGEFRGQIRFQGLSSGHSRRVALGGA